MPSAGPQNAAMKVTFRQSGGLAGLTRGCELDSETLPAAEARRLEKLVAKSGLEGVESASPPAARDLVTYEITVEREGGTESVRFDDLSVPDAAAPLLELLQGCAKAHPPR